MRRTSSRSSSSSAPAQLVGALEDHDVVEVILGRDRAIGARDADVETEQEGIAVLGAGVVPDAHDDLVEMAGELLGDVVERLGHEGLEAILGEAERHREVVGREARRAAGTRRRRRLGRPADRDRARLVMQGGALDAGRRSGAAHGGR